MATRKKPVAAKKPSRSPTKTSARRPSKRPARREAGAPRGLYPALLARRTGTLPVSGGHELYFEESGNPRGKPVVFLHGGPGGGTDAKMRRFFDPKRYRIVLFDQRGCGRSTPHASLVENTTWDLVSDIERLRAHLGIERWQVFGGSWGSTLALAYAQAHPERVTELVLRGIFLIRPSELAWFYQDEHGAASLFPDRFHEYQRLIPVEERGDMVRAYYARLTHEDPSVVAEAARAWSVWEGATSYLEVHPDKLARYADPEFAAAFARIECHYFLNGGFLRTPTQLLDDVDKIRHIPAVIIQGRYDVVCPMRSAWELHRAWPEADFEVISDAGHSAFEAGITAALVRATDRFARR